MKIVINKYNLNTGLANKFKSVIYSSSTWHKIMVENAQDLEHDFILKTLMNAVHPLDFIPLSYAVYPKHISFLLKNCGAALDRLCRHNLVVANPNNKNKPFFVSIELCFANATELEVNVQSNVVSVIQKRLSEDGVLNLEQFYKDPTLHEFCPLSQPKLMFFVLLLSKSYNVKVLKLGNNHIEILKPLEALYGVKSLICLDLRNNNISNAAELKALKDLSITELWLDGNPVCDEFDEFTYGRAMQEIISGLVKLDGFTVMKKGGFIPFRRNFLCNLEGQELVDQFLEHYFTLYDSPNRNVLNGVYHKQAMFSLTSRYLKMQSTSQNAKLYSYSQFSRNLKQISNFSKNDLYLFRGPQSILKILNTLPRTEHDPYTFTVDLMTYTDTTAIIVVTGVFQELYESKVNIGRQYGFVRSFVLLAGQNSEYTIVNEQLHVSNATTIQALKAFKIPRPRKLNYIQIPPPQNLKERYEMIETMRIITGLSMEWSKNCLEDAQYNLKNALTTFLEFYKLDKIPQNAFDRESETGPEQQNSDLQKIPETLLIAKDSNKSLNKGQKTTAYNFELESVSLPIELMPKRARSEVSISSSSPKSITKKAEDADISKLSYMNDDGISTIRDNSESKREDKPPAFIIQPSSKEPKHSKILHKLENVSPKKEDERYRPPLAGNMENSPCSKEKPENILTRPKTSVACSASIPTAKELAKFISQQPRSFFYNKSRKKMVKIQLADGKFMRMLKMEALRRGLIPIGEPPAVNVQHSLKEPGQSEIFDKLENVSPKKECEKSRPPLLEEPRQSEILDKLQNVSSRKEDERCGPPVSKEPRHSELLDELEDVSPKIEDEQYRPPLPGSMENSPCSKEKLEKILTRPETSVACSGSISTAKELAKFISQQPRSYFYNKSRKRMAKIQLADGKFVRMLKMEALRRGLIPIGEPPAVNMQHSLKEPGQSEIFDKLENVSAKKEDEKSRPPLPEEIRHSELLDKLENVFPRKEDERPPLPGNMENSSCNKEKPENILTRPKTSVACSASIPTEEELAKFISQQPRSCFYRNSKKRRIRVQLANGKYMRMLKIEALRRGLITLEEPPAVNVQESLKQPGHSEILDKLENVSPKKEDEQPRPPLPEEPRQSEILDKLENVSSGKEDERCGPPVSKEPRHSELLDESENVFPEKEDEQYGPPLPEEPSHSELLDELENVSPKKEDEQCRPPVPEEPRHSKLLDKLENVFPKKEDERPPLPGNMENSPCSKEKPENILTRPETSVACSTSIPAVRRN